MLNSVKKILPRLRSQFRGRLLLGRYDILGRIATGGMATVYRAQLRGIGGFSRNFAIKVIHPHLCHTAEFADRFTNEAKLASRVHHPNVVSTVDAGSSRGLHYIVLELVDGVNLRQVTVARSASLPPAQAARIVADAARGLHALHSLGHGSSPVAGALKTYDDDRPYPAEVVHRDLSPHNLMLDVTGRTVLIDLGLAKVRGQGMHTQTGVLCGKLAYMSPEQSRGEEVDARSDIFSLGAVLFELAAGEPPFGEDHSPGTLERLRRCDTAKLAEQLRDAGAPQWLSSTVLTCLQREREARFQTAMALAGALEDEAHFAGIDLSEVRQQLATLAARVADDARHHQFAREHRHGRPATSRHGSGFSTSSESAGLSELEADLRIVRSNRLRNSGIALAGIVATCFSLGWLVGDEGSAGSDSDESHTVRAGRANPTDSTSRGADGQHDARHRRASSTLQSLAGTARAMSTKTVNSLSAAYHDSSTKAVEVALRRSPALASESVDDELSAAELASGLPRQLGPISRVLAPLSFVGPPLVSTLPAPAESGEVPNASDAQTRSKRGSTRTVVHRRRPKSGKRTRASKAKAQKALQSTPLRSNPYQP